MSATPANAMPKMARASHGPTARSRKMTTSVNRILDVLVSFATVGLALTIAGATAFLGV